MKKILITGCSDGFGYKSAKFFAKEGHHVYASMRNIKGENAKSASELKEFASSKGYQLEVLEIDVRSDESVIKTIAKIPDIDVLINNPEPGFGGAIESISSKECLDQLDSNIVGALRVTKAVLPKMRKRKSGLIIQVSSIAGRSALPGLGIYHASNWGLEGLSEALRYELAPLGIDVVIVEPGPFEPNFFGDIIQSKDSEIANAYKHVDTFFKGFEKQVNTLLKEKKTAKNSMSVVETFDKLINTPTGKRPLRTVAGLDFGLKTLNDVVEPIRKSRLAEMGLANFDGPNSKFESEIY